MATKIGNANGNTLNGTQLDDLLIGNGGSDRLTGNGGNDVIITGTGGNDLINGGTGTDTVVLTGNFSDYTISFGTYSNPGPATNIPDGSAVIILTGPGGVVETITAVEKIVFDDRVVDVVGAGSLTSTIQSAVDAADDGDTILIAPGVHTENVTIDGKQVELLGLDGATLNGQITISGTLDAGDGLDGQVRITNIDINAAGHAYGVLVNAHSSDFSGGVTITDSSISNADQNGLTYVRAGNEATPNVFTDTLGSISVIDTSFADNGNVNTGSGGRGDILLFGYNQDLTLDGVTITNAGPLAQKAVQIRGLQDGGDVAGVGPYDAAGDVSLTDVSITGSYLQDMVAVYRIADFDSFDTSGVTLNGSAPWGLINFDSVGGEIDISGGVTGSNSGGPGIIGLFQGLSTADDFTGTSGNDTFVGRGGADTMAGGAGNDTYYADASDTIVETGGGGTDTINTSVNFALAGGVEVENINSTGSGLTLTGNEYAQTITGDAGVNSLNGDAGNDTLVGNAGADSFDGGAGSDVIYGGTIAADDANTTIDTATYAGGTISWNGTAWEVNDGDGGIDTLHGIEKVVINGATTWLVDKTAGGGLSTIQSAIDAAGTGDTVMVASGTFDENVTITQGVSLIGFYDDHTVHDRDHAFETIINGTVTVSAASGDVTLQGLEFLNSSNNATLFNAVVVTGGADVTVYRNYFYSTGANGSNANGSGDFGVFLQSGATGDNVVSGNIFTGASVAGFSTASWRSGVWSDGNSSSLDISGNVFEYVRAGMNLDSFDNATTTVDGNLFHSTGTGISFGIDTLGPVTVTGITNNVFNDVGDEFNFQNVTTAIIFDVAASGNTSASPNAPFVADNTPTIRILGGTAGDELSGSNGADILVGNGGDDTLKGAGGDDTITGGAGTGDTAYFSGNRSDYLVSWNGMTQTFTIADQRMGAPDGTDTVTGVEFFTFADGTLTAQQVFNDAPTANPDTDTATEGTGIINGFVGTNDTDPDLPGETFAYSLLNGPIAGLSLNPVTGEYTFDSNDAAYNHLALNATTDVVANYRITDSFGNTSDSTLTITVTGTNDAPVAVADTNSATEGGAVINGTVADTDPDDGAVLSYAVTNGPIAGLTFNNTTGAYTFDPTVAAYNHLALNAMTDVVVDYTVTDEHGASVPSTLTITVTGTNDAPVAVADTNSATEGGAVINGTVADTDPDDGAVLSYAVTNGPIAGLTFNNTTGGYSFDPTVAAYNHLALNATTDVVVDYTVTDEHGALVSSTLTITVTGTNDAPVAVADTNSATEGGAVINGTVADTDPDDGAVLSYAVTNGPIPGLTSFNTATGAYTFDPTDPAYDYLNAGDTLPVVVNYTVTDQHGASVSSTLTITLTGTSEVQYGDGNANTLTGSAFNDELYGLGGSDTLIGNAGNDLLDGGTGIDNMTGGLGDDTYYVDNTDDIVVEFTGEGTDLVYSSVDYTLTNNVENLTLTGSDNIFGVGNALVNIIYGNSGDNVLDGKGGSDTYYGGAGNDTYFVNTASELSKITELLNEGDDTIISSVSVTSLADNVENIILEGAATNATGNSLNNTINGNNLANILNGGTGEDVLVGGLGNDTYIVDNVNDVVVEINGQGTDTVQSSVSYTLSDFVENLTLTVGGGAINGTGSAQANTITGNSSVNVLNGGAGNDTLTGGGGADTFMFDTTLNASTNVDTITDFIRGTDKIGLASALFGAIGGTLDAGELRSGAGFTTAADANDYLIYNSTTGDLYYDADGSGAGAAIKFAKLTTVAPALTIADFTIV